MQRFFVFLLVISSAFFMVVPTAHAAPLSGINCYRDTCDGYFPHNTDGGANCVSRNLTLEASFQVSDAYDPIGQIDLYASPGGCNAAWATWYQYSVPAQQFTVTTCRVTTTDDPLCSNASYSGSNTWSFNDGRMLGWDTESPGDCFYAEIQIKDRYGVWHDNGTSTLCGL